MKKLVKPLEFNVSHIELLQESGTTTAGNSNGAANGNSIANGNNSSNTSGNNNSIGNGNNNSVTNTGSGTVTVVNGSTGGGRNCGSDIQFDDILF